MKVAGTFDPKELYYRQKNNMSDSSFAAVLTFNLDKKPGKDDVTALFASNSSELERLYEQMTGKKLTPQHTTDNVIDENEAVVTFFSRRTVRGYRTNGLPDTFGNTHDEWLIPVNTIPSNRNMRCLVR